MNTTNTVSYSFVGDERTSNVYNENDNINYDKLGLYGPFRDIFKMLPAKKMRNHW